MAKSTPLTADSFMELWKTQLLPSIREEIREEITRQMQSIKGELQALDERYSSIEQSQQFLGKKYDELLQSLQATKQSISSTTSMVKTQQDAISSNCEEIAKLQNLIDEHEQYSRRDCLEVIGIPKTPDEDPAHLVAEVGKLVGMDIDERDISIAHRLPDQKSVKDRLIVKFTKRTTRDALYRSRTRLTSKSVKDLRLKTHPSVGSKRIFINESLTSARKKLLGRINKYKKDNQYKFIWTNNGKIFIKKNEENKTCGPFTTDAEFERFANQIN